MESAPDLCGGVEHGDLPVPLEPPERLPGMPGLHGAFVPSLVHRHPRCAHQQAPHQAITIPRRPSVTSFEPPHRHARRLRRTSWRVRP
eukprot:41038-Eustigmatos_ZCMA.PRE.1